MPFQAWHSPDVLLQAVELVTAAGTAYFTAVSFWRATTVCCTHHMRHLDLAHICRALQLVLSAGTCL